MENAIWEIIESISKTISKLGCFIYPDGSTPEEKTLISVLKKILSNERDSLNALEYLYTQITKDKPGIEITAFTKETLSNFREQKKLIK